MKKNKIYSLTLSLLLFSACSTKNIEKDVKDDVKKDVKIEEQNRINNRSNTRTHVRNNLGTNIRTNNNSAVTTDDDTFLEIDENLDSDSDYVDENLPEISYNETQREVYSEIPKEVPNEIQPQEEFYRQPQIQQFSGEQLQGAFQGNYELLSFIDRMVSIHSFDKKYLNQIFSQAQNYNYTPRTQNCNSNLINSGGAWDRYKNCFIYEKNIQRGIDFWNQYEDTLNRAEARYGVPVKYIIGILGIETAYGVNFGKYRVIDVLTTKAMLGGRRSSFYKDELEKYLMISRDIGIDVTATMGSTSGALGYGQFMPSSYIKFAVDFNSDGKKDLWNAEDAIGSIANYFAVNGWNSSISQVAVRAKYRGRRFRRLRTGYKTRYSLYRLKKRYHIIPRGYFRPHGRVSLIKLPRGGYDELWLGSPNFRVITTYNHNTYYGMTVYQLGEEIERRRNRGY